MITQQEAIEIIDRWPREMTPRYRGFVCGGCAKENMHKAWHIHVDQPPYKRELHLCYECGLAYNLNKGVKHEA